MRHRKMLAPINSVKHYVQMENAGLTEGQKRTVDLVDAVVAPATSSTADVKQGSIVKAIFLEWWIKSNATAATNAKFQLIIEKVVSGQDSITFTQANNLATYPNKKNILFYSQGVVGDETTNSIPIFKNWILIPKGKQRFGLGDKFVATITATGDALNNCGFATYKEYT